MTSASDDVIIHQYNDIILGMTGIHPLPLQLPHRLHGHTLAGGAYSLQVHTVLVFGAHLLLVVAPILSQVHGHTLAVLRLVQVNSVWRLSSFRTLKNSCCVDFLLKVNR